MKKKKKKFIQFILIWTCLKIMQTSFEIYCNFHKFPLFSNIILHQVTKKTSKIQPSNKKSKKISCWIELNWMCVYLVLYIFTLINFKEKTIHTVSCLIQHWLMPFRLTVLMASLGIKSLLPVDGSSNINFHKFPVMKRGIQTYSQINLNSQTRLLGAKFI